MAVREELSVISIASMVTPIDSNNQLILRARSVPIVVISDHGDTSL